MDQDAKLQRDFAKNGDTQRPDEFGGGVSSGSGIGN